MLRYWTQAFKKLGLKSKAARKEARKIFAVAFEPSKHAEILQNIQGTLDNSGVICLTDQALDDRMWDEYAGGYRGICLCFETSEEPFSTTYYVNYMAELPIVKINANSEEQIEAFLLTKGIAYSWERERRFVDYNKSGGYKPISPWRLQAIVFGSQAEAPMKEEVIRLVGRWKPHVSLFTSEASGSGSPRLQLLDDSPTTRATRIIPPIQERLSRESVERAKSAQLLEYQDWMLPEHKRPNLDSRIRNVAANLKAVERSQGRRTQEVSVAAMDAVQEGTDLLREIVDRAGSAIPGYGDVAVHLYRLMHAMVTNKSNRRPS